MGFSTVGRDGLEDLLYMARREPRPVDGIIFWSFSRMARDQLDSQFIKVDLRRRGYALYSMTDDIPDGEFAPVVEALIDLHDLAAAGYAPAYLQSGGLCHARCPLFCQGWTNLCF